ncbi:unnamed protein product [Spirodela intermedia]|uniref:Uncharacterized protein n=1 Tax=Spirodela intermedia TaxID=51605 RepID=A0A7I8LHA0_SPIIN|nr:unnamed protein product [Spirodela intermedia]
MQFSHNSAAKTRDISGTYVNLLKSRASSGRLSQLDAGHRRYLPPPAPAAAAGGGTYFPTENYNETLSEIANWAIYWAHDKDPEILMGWNKQFPLHHRSWTQMSYWAFSPQCLKSHRDPSSQGPAEKKIHAHSVIRETRCKNSAFLVNFLDLGPGAAAAAVGGFPGRSSAAAARAGGAALLVHAGDDGITDLLQLLELVLELLHLGQLVAVQPLHGLLHLFLDLLPLRLRHLLPHLLVPHGVPHVVGVVLQRVLRLHLLLHLLVLRPVLLRLLYHLLDLVLAQPPLIVDDGDPVLHPRGLVLRRHVQNPVGVDVEADVDLGHPSRRRRDSGELELAQKIVVLGSSPLSFIYLDQNSRLVIRVGGEDLLLFCGNGGVAGDQHCHDSTGGLQPEAQRRNVEEEEVLHLLVTFSGENRRLHGGAVCHRLVGVDALTELLPVEEHHLIDGRLVQLGISQALLHGLHTPPKQVHVQLLESGARDGGVEVNALEEGVDLHSGLRRGAEAAEGARVAGEVLLVFAAELGGEVVDHAVVEVFPSQMGVPGSGFDFEDSFLDGQQRYVEGPPAKVKDEDVLLPSPLRLLVQPVGDGGGGWLVDDPHHVEPRNGAGVFGGLPLPVRHVRLDGRVREAPADEALGVEDGVRRVHGDLVLGGVADEPLRVGEGDVGRGRPVPLVVGDDLHSVVLPHAHAAVGRPQVYSDCLPSPIAAATAALRRRHLLSLSLSLSLSLARSLASSEYRSGWGVASGSVLGLYREREMVQESCRALGGDDAGYRRKDRWKKTMVVPPRVRGESLLDSAASMD